MLDALLKPKFYNKCKVAIKLTKNRLEAINKKRSAMLKFLKKDIADLLNNAHDYNAYGRAEGLIVEKNMTCCYKLIEDFCGCILTNLSTMLKQSECPEECREAVSSLVFAAARFAELPELRELRSLFSDKYGKSVENFINKEFASRLRPEPPSKEVKVQLMRDIALETSLKWDSKALEQKLFTPPPTIANETTRGEEQDKEDFIIKCSSRTTRENEFGVQRKSEEPKGNQKLRWSKDAGDNKNGVLPLKMELTTNKKEATVETTPEEEVAEKKKKPSYRKIPPPYVIAEASPKATEQQPKPRSVRQRRLQKPQPPEEEKKFGTPPSRIVSLPPDDAVKEAEDWREENHNLRATSLQPDMYGSSYGYVHPKLPDYDDLATRMAALRKK